MSLSNSLSSLLDPASDSVISGSTVNLSNSLSSLLDPASGSVISGSTVNLSNSLSSLLDPASGSVISGSTVNLSNSLSSLLDPASGSVISGSTMNLSNSLSSLITNSRSWEVAYAPPLFTLPALGQRRRRFELLLPLQFNNGKDIPKKLIEEARREIIDQFGGLSCETAAIDGYWQNKGLLVQDALIRIWVDAPDLETSREWMKNFKQRWKRILRQDDLWLVDFEVHVS